MVRNERRQQRGGNRGGDRRRDEDEAPGPTDRHAGRPTLRRHITQHAVDASEQEQLSLAIGALADVSEQLGVVTVLEQVRQELRPLLVTHGESSPSNAARRLRPRRFQLLTEPSATRSSAAIALSVMSS